jgi:hypothetical protein
MSSSSFPTKVLLLSVIFMSCQSTANRSLAPRSSQGVSKEAFVAKLSEFDECQGIEQQVIDDFHSRLDQCDNYVHSPVETEMSNPETPVESGFALGAGGGLPRLITNCYKAICGWFKKAPEPKKADTASSPDARSTPGIPGATPRHPDSARTPKPQPKVYMSPEQFVEEILKKNPKEILDELGPYSRKADALSENDLKVCDLPKGCDPSSDFTSCPERPMLNAITCEQRMRQVVACGVRILRRTVSERCSHIRVGGVLQFYGTLMVDYADDYASCARCARNLPSNN